MGLLLVVVGWETNVAQGQMGYKACGRSNSVVVTLHASSSRSWIWCMGPFILLIQSSKMSLLARVWGGVARLRWVVGESSRTMEGPLHVYKLELEYQNSHNAMAHASGRLNVRVL